jgi:hypothetical protein
VPGSVVAPPVSLLLAGVSVPEEPDFTTFSPFVLSLTPQPINPAIAQTIMPNIIVFQIPVFIAVSPFQK